MEDIVQKDDKTFVKPGEFEGKLRLLTHKKISEIAELQRHKKSD